MNPFKKLYHWIMSDLFVFFALRPVLKELRLVPDLKKWITAVIENDDESLQETSMKIADLALKDELLPKSDCEHMRFHSILLYQYALWLTKSKRVYMPSDVLVSMLLHTDLPPYKAGDIKYVFDAFAVQLQTPIVSRNGTKHSLLLFCVEPDAISIASIDAEAFLNYHPLDDGEIERLFNESRDGSNSDRRTQAHKLISENLYEWRTDGVVKTYVFSTPPGLTYEECICDTPEDDLNGWSDVLRLIIGLNLYLQSDGRSADIPGEPLAENLVRVAPVDPTVNLFRETELIELAVSREHEWTQVMRALNGTGTPLVGVHIRTGHWRKYQPGKLVNHPLGLEKWIEPTLVHGSGTVGPNTIFSGRIQPVGSKLRVMDPQVASV